MRLAADPGRVAAGHLAPLVSRGDVPSLAYAVVRDGVVELGGFGGADPQTIFEIGSVTKVFTALLLAEMAERGEVHLSDPAARYLPAAAGGLPPPDSPRDLAGGTGLVTLADSPRDLPGRTGPVTLADLATHTSGLPRLPPGLWWSALASPRDPYARYPARRFARAARRSLRRASAPNPYAYSNYGYGLLGYLLGQAAGSAYEALVIERICRPLGLEDTTFEVPREGRARKAQGHARGRAAPDWHMGVLAAAGGLHSTAADLARLLRACLAPAATPLAGVIRAAVRPRAAIPSGQIGLAWHHTRRPNSAITWHNGMTGGFSSMIAFDPGRNLGVAALANSAGVRPSPLDAAVFEAVDQ